MVIMIIVAVIFLFQSVGMMTQAASNAGQEMQEHTVAMGAEQVDNSKMQQANDNLWGVAAILVIFAFLVTMG